MVLAVKVGKGFGYLARKSGRSHRLWLKLELLLLLLLVCYQEHPLWLLDS
jgi:hypothetical protein